MKASGGFGSWRGRRRKIRNLNEVRESIQVGADLDASWGFPCARHRDIGHLESSQCSQTCTQKKVMRRALPPTQYKKMQRTATHCSIVTFPREGHCGISVTPGKIYERFLFKKETEWWWSTYLYFDDINNLVQESDWLFELENLWVTHTRRKRGKCSECPRDTLFASSSLQPRSQKETGNRVDTWLVQIFGSFPRLV